MLTGKKLMINDLEIDGINEIDALVLEHLKEKGIEITQDLKNELITVNYSPTADAIFIKDEEQDVIVIESEEFESLFKEILMILFEKAITDFELNQALEEFDASQANEQITFDESETANMPETLEITEVVIEQEPAAKPGIFAQFVNGCEYYLNAGYEKVFGKPEASESEEKSSPRPGR